MKGNYAVFVAAGKGTRMGAEINKVFLPLCGRPVLFYTLLAFEQAKCVSGIVIVCAGGEEGIVRGIASGFNKVISVVPGGATRQESVENGLNALPEDAEIVLVQDGARPLTTVRLIEDCVEAVKEHGSAVACGRVVDTIKTENHGFVVDTLDRSLLRAVQTPQSFYVDELKNAYKQAREMGLRVTDDASVMEAAGKPVYLLENAENTLKVTTPEDMVLAEAILWKRSGNRNMPTIGNGYDVHRLTQGRRLVLCGVEIPYEKGLDGHSDADVALHALMDALLGAAGLGDIGRLFPDNDPKFEGIDSMLLLEDVIKRLNGRKIVNVDVTIIAQCPKLMPYIPQMVKRLQEVMPETLINVKATTTEHLGFEGRGEGIAAQAVALLW